LVTVPASTVEEGACVAGVVLGGACVVVDGASVVVGVVVVTPGADVQAGIVTYGPASRPRDCPLPTKTALMSI
jgi:hypothetical protein